MTKYAARVFLAPRGSWTLIPGVFDLTFSRNTGMAFSIFEDKAVLLTGIVSIINILILLYYLSLANNSLTVNLGFSLIIAGGLSNLLDRYIFGYVTDFINPTFVRFAIFNFADLLLNLGVLLLLFRASLRGNLS
jgi:signal peptidase II